MKVLIMGGGMSGLATAVNLVDMGVEVELIEGDNMFGGRASSWQDEDGDMIDNALHVFFPYYVNLVGFFKKLGIEDNIVWKSKEFYYAQENGDHVKLAFPALPAPLHVVAAYINFLKGYKGAPVWKSLVGMYGLAKMVSANKEEVDKLDEVSWGMWGYRKGPLDTYKSNEAAIHGLTFTPYWGISAKVMANWFKKVSASHETARVGFANGGLGEIWVDSCLDYIRKKGGKCELNQRVTAIDVKDGQITGVTVNGKEKKKADVYISALSPYALRTLIPNDSFRLKYFQDVNYFEEAPSLSIQVWFDKKLTDVDVTFFSDNCIFNTYADLSNVLPHIFKGGSMYEMVLSPADHIRHLPDEVIFEETLADIKKLFPEARDAKVKKWKVVRERQGVYRAAPGMEAHRPFQRSPYSNFYLTGDWTSTPVSSGGMEAAIWTANKTSEVFAFDKLDKKVELNKDFDPPKGFMPLVKPLVMLSEVAAVAAVLKVASFIFRARK